MPPTDMLARRDDDLYVTPAHVVQHIEAHTVIDAACGSGAFLTRIAPRTTPERHGDDE